MKYRNQNRKAGSPVLLSADPLPVPPDAVGLGVPPQHFSSDGRSGSCLRLWRRRTIREVLFRLGAPTAPQSSAAGGGLGGPESPAEVRRSLMLGARLEIAQEEAAATRLGNIASLQEPRVDAVRDAWVRLIAEHMDTSEGAFCTLTYSDGYGYPHGLMLARNCLADWRRFLKSQGLSLPANPWTCCIERHQERDILHLHALLGGVDSAESRFGLQEAWQRDRGFCRISPILDGGVRYCAKYATKSLEAAMFEWSWRDAS